MCFLSRRDPSLASRLFYAQSRNFTTILPLSRMTSLNIYLPKNYFPTMK